jgi:Alw26I/Eco31I/Esp3I family type II restriction m6 adenine DNA methyltransferase
MLHIDYIQKEISKQTDAFIKKASGRYYTGEIVGRRLAQVVSEAYSLSNPYAKTIRIIDPFGGDGRLIEWFISSWIEKSYPSVNWFIEVWDMNGVDFNSAKLRLNSIVSDFSANSISFKLVDSFKEVIKHENEFDIVLTNPPWELLKPDNREIEQLKTSCRVQYISKMRKYDSWIAVNYPLSQPKHKFAGWGTNLSRVGLEASLRLVRKNGFLGIVLPASFLADDQSSNLRESILTRNSLFDIAYYPAEAKLYDSADVSSVTIAVKASDQISSTVPLLTHTIVGADERTLININQYSLNKIGFVLPISFGSKAIKILTRLASCLPKWSDYEQDVKCRLWAGRELDETGRSKWLKTLGKGLPPFVKGRMIDRYYVREAPWEEVCIPKWKPPVSTSYTRIVWRDVTRSSQRRRVIAALIPSGWVAGNSLGVAYFKSDNNILLKTLLGVMNSTCFEFQLRAYLATGHISLGSLRKVAMPPSDCFKNDKELAKIVSYIIKGKVNREYIADAYVAKMLYKISCAEYKIILGLFDKISSNERAEFLKAYRSIK